MSGQIKTALHKSFRAFGLDIVRFRDPEHDYPPDFGREEIEIIARVRPWTMTSPERILALVHAVRYVTANSIPGAVVECGVWKGGSMAAVAHTLKHLNVTNRDLFLFDTFQGMSAPSERDSDYSGKLGADLLVEAPAFKCADAPLECVKQVLGSTGYPKERVHFVQGKVEDTIPANAPDSIALLRLDTDWYESTKHELVNLFPRLSSRGVLIIDDYGHWQGARQACDEYFKENKTPILLNRIDYTGRMALKL